MTEEKNAIPRDEKDPSQVKQRVLDLMGELIAGCNGTILEEVGVIVPFVLVVYPEGSPVIASNIGADIAVDVLIKTGRKLEEKNADPATSH